MIHYKAFAKLKRIAPLYLGHAFKTEKKRSRNKGPTHLLKVHK